MPKRIQVDIAGTRLELSNLEKVFYPKVGFTKAQVIDYYVRVAPALLPHLKDRPVSLKRYPDGVTGPYFFEKQAPSHRPAWIETTPVQSEHRRIDYCMINSLPALVWASNLANLELHTFLHRAPKITVPTMLAFDLDPGEGADILLCSQVGIWIRDLLNDLEIASFPKTSGSKGLQLYVPLNSPTTYEKTKTFARALAQRLESEHPEQVVSQMQKKLRVGKVFVDWSQNDEHKTTVTVYSLRAKDRPTVSTPVTWEEIEVALRKKDPNLLVFESHEVLDRVEKNGDLFEPVLKLKQKLPSLKALLGSERSSADKSSSIVRKTPNESGRTGRAPAASRGGAKPAKRKSGRQSAKLMHSPKGNESPLSKAKDEWTSQKEVITQDRSILTGKRIEEYKNPGALVARRRVSADTTALRELRPMLAKSTDAAFDDAEWIFELKLDGYRALAFVDRLGARLISRTGNDLSSAYPAIIDELAASRVTAIFDGEIVVLDEDGIPGFELLQNYRKVHQGHLVYYVFDLLFLNGRDLRDRSLIERKKTLQRILNVSEIVRYVDHVDGTGKKFFNLAKERGLEGIIAKRKTAVYLNGKRGDHWLKIKCRPVQEAILCGFTESRVNQNSLGALLLGVHEGAELKYAGLVGTGLNRAPGLITKLRKLVARKRPFKTIPKTDMPIYWVEPTLVCSVEFHEWTKDGILRGASFLSLRSDKPAAEVLRERGE